MSKHRAEGPLSPFDPQSPHEPVEHPALDVGHAVHEREPEAITFLERLEGTTDEITAAIAEIHQFLTAVTTPAENRILTFTAANPIVRDKSGIVHLSYGIYNPNSLLIYVAIGGELARPGSGALTIPANSLVVLPLNVRDVDVGVDPADPALAGGVQLSVRVFRFATVQPAFLGAL